MADRAAHTPGPWEIQELPDNEGGGPSYRITGRSTLFLTVSECSDGYVPGENEANARLIAAAPDLLLACQDAAAVMETLGVEHLVAYEQLLAAIAKATDT